jgi:hypothetical protein
MDATWRGRWLGPLAAPARVAAVAWVVVFLVISVRVMVKPRRHSVYPIFADAGAKWLAGQDLYQRTDLTLDCYRYGPLVAAAFAPFSLLPDGMGNVLWRALGTAVYLAALAWWARAVLARLPATAALQPWTAAQSGVLFLLVLPLSVGNLNNGQSNFLVLGLILLALAGAAEERWNLAGACLAGACLFKVYPIAVGLLLALVYPRRFAGRLAAGLAVGLALPFLLQRPGYVAAQYVRWLEHLGAGDRQDMTVLSTYRDLRLLFRVWLVPLSAHAYLAIQLGVAALIAGICFWKSGGRRRLLFPGRAADPHEVLLLLLSLSCCWMTVFGAATESATYILLAPALASLVLQIRREGGPRWAWGLVAASYGLFLLAQVANWFPFGKQFHSYGSQPLAALLFFGYVLLRAGRGGGLKAVAAAGQVGLTSRAA